MDFLKSDLCNRCEGKGFYLERSHPELLVKDYNEFEQCPECQELHQQELMADIMQDMMKGN